MQYLVISHFDYDRDLRTSIHHGKLLAEIEDITYVEAGSLYNAADAAHKQAHTHSEEFTRYRMIVVPLGKNDKIGMMEFTVDPPGGAVIKPAKSRVKATKK